jgi:hypothetical protein
MSDSPAALTFCDRRYALLALGEELADRLNPPRSGDAELASDHLLRRPLGQPGRDQCLGEQQLGRRR